MSNLLCSVGRLREAIQSAADQAGASGNSSGSSSTANERDRGPSAKHLKPIVTAVEMVFGSAAALSATFGFKVQSLHNRLPCLTGCRLSFELSKAFVGPGQVARQVSNDCLDVWTVLESHLLATIARQVFDA